VAAEINYLTGLSRQEGFRRLLVAPTTLRPRIRDLIVRETDHARAGRPARIVAKVNALVDPEMIELLYEASQAGVEVDCIVRGACSLHPGLPGTSERIRVRSIIGEFLEHSRILGFANGGRQEWYTGSADLMERNLDRRVEVVFPIEDLEAQARIEEIITVMLADDRRSWQLGADAAWRRTEEILAAPGTLDTFAVLKERALAAASEPVEPPLGNVPAGSLDPRA
jgi:polyphosphate kinase